MKKNKSQPNQFITVEEACELLGVDKELFMNMVETEKLTKYRFKGLLDPKFNKSDIMELISKRKKERQIKKTL